MRVWVLTYKNGDVAGVYSGWKKAVATQAKLLRDGHDLVPLHQVEVNGNVAQEPERAEDVESEERPA